MKDYYRILEVSEYASEDIIKNAYKTLSKKYHPDLHKEQYKFYENKMKEINEAYSILIDKDKRAEYDIALKKEQQTLSQPTIIYQNPYQSAYEQQTTEEQKIVPDKRLKIIMTTFALISITIFIIILSLCFKVFLPETIKNIDIGIDKKYVITNYGEPKIENSNYLIYDTFVITLNQNKITGWIDIDKKLNLGDKKEFSTKHVRVGDSLEKVIDKYGNPDVLLENIAIYDNTVLYISDHFIKDIKTIE